MLRGISAWVLSGGLLAGVGLPQQASAHASGEFVAFVAGTAVGYLLNANDDVRHVHHYHRPPRQGYVVLPPGGPGGWYAAPPVHVVHHYDDRRYYQERSHQKYRSHHKHKGGWKRGHRGHHDD